MIWFVVVIILKANGPAFITTAPMSEELCKPMAKQMEIIMLQKGIPTKTQCVGLPKKQAT